MTALLALSQRLRPLYTTLLVVNLLHYSVAVFFFIRWRKRFPIGGRKVWLCVSIGTAACMWTSFELVKGITGTVPCAAELVFAIFSLFWLVNAYLVRAWRIWFLFYMACEQLERELSKSFFHAKPVEEDEASENSQEFVKLQVENNTEHGRARHGRGSVTVRVTDSEHGPAELRPSLTLTASVAPIRERERDRRDSAPLVDYAPAQFSPSSRLEMQRLSMASTYTQGSVLKMVDHAQEANSDNVFRSTSQKSLDSVSTLANDHGPSPTSGSGTGSGTGSGSGSGSGDDMDGLKKQSSTREQLEESHRCVKQRRRHRRNLRAQRRDTGESTWFADRKHYWTSANMAKFTVGITLVEIIGPIASFTWETQQDDYIAVDTVCASVETSLWIFSGVAGAAILFGIWTAWRLRKIQDGFFIKRELKIASLAGLISTLTANIFSPSEQHIQVPLYFIGGTIFLYSVFTEHVIRAWRDSRRRTLKAEKQRQQQSVAESVYPEGCSPNLSAVFDNPAELEDFTEHLKREFSTENVLYYLEATRFKQQCEDDVFDSMEERNYRAAEIYADYVADESPLQVNLSSTLRVGVLTSLNSCIRDFSPDLFVRLSAQDRRGSVVSVTTSNISASVQQTCVAPIPSDVFGSSARAIFKLMEQDSFVRFKEARARRLRAEEMGGVRLPTAV